MFIGHVGVGLAAKRLAPNTSLGLQAVGFAGLALWLLPVWAWWFDSRRTHSG